MNGKVAVVGFFLVAVAVVAWMALSRSDPAPSGVAEGKAEDKSGGAPPATTTTIELMYGTEKENWLKEVLADFAKAHPEIQVNARGRGSLDSVRDILDEKEKPTLWSPADHVALNLLRSDWQQKTGRDLLGGVEPQPLVLTPLVFVAWQDRADVLAQGATTISWKRIAEVVSAPQGWPAVGGKADWGFVKIGHTDPTRSNSGLQALLLIAYAHFGKASLEIADVLDPGYQSFAATIEKGVPNFGASSGTYMRDMVLYGPSKYDLIVTYESLAIEQLPNAQGRWGNLRVYYPERTMWSSHPIALLDAAWVTPEQKAAAQILVAFLRDKPAQQKAVRFGFRPSDPSVPVITQDAVNPFNAAQAHGVRIDIPPVVEPPAGPVVRNVMEMWNRTIRR